MQRKFLFLILTVFVGVNFVGALGPELGFDALWYHLTIPKVYLMWGQIRYIPGGLLYYSAMPKLGELLFMTGGANWLFAHLVSFFFGIGVVTILYKMTKSWLAPVIFYVTPLVGWLSGSAYIDLIRAFFEVLAYYFVTRKKYFIAGIAIALAVGTKTLALGSVAVLAIIIYLNSRNFKSVLTFLFSFAILAAPWFIVSWLWTGNPVYPIGSGILDSRHNLIIPNPLDLITLFTTSQDPISPIYLIALPFIITKPYVFLTALLWLVTPRTDWGRFILPYLPVWAIYTSQIKSKLISYLVIFIAIINVGYRVMAERKLVPYLVGRQTVTEYLCQNLDFKTSVFVDCDSWFAKNIKPTDKVFVQNVHNLYYINFPYVHESWWTNEPYNYILTYNKIIDKKLVYENSVTGMRLYAY